MAGKCCDCKGCISSCENETGQAEANLEEIFFTPGIILKQLNFDEKKSIELIDKENLIISIPFSKAKPIFGEAAILERTPEGYFCIDVIFNKQCFGDSNYLVIK